MGKDKIKNIFINTFCKKENHNLNLCIYCLGEYGLQLYFTLKECGIKINCFGDSDIKKQGYALDNIHCYSFCEIVNLKDNIFVIVSMKNPEILVDKLKKAGISNVLTKDEVLNLLDEHHITRTHNFASERLDYTKDEYIHRINSFRFNLYDVYCNGKKNMSTGEEHTNNSFESELQTILTNWERYVREHNYEHS